MRGLILLCTADAVCALARCYWGATNRKTSFPPHSYTFPKFAFVFFGDLVNCDRRHIEHTHTNIVKYTALMAA